MKTSLDLLLDTTKEYLYYDLENHNLFIWNELIPYANQYILYRRNEMNDICKIHLTNGSRHLIFSYNRKTIDEMNKDGISDEEILNRFCFYNDFSGYVYEKILPKAEYDALLEDVKHNKGKFKLL